ncbi:hypothetical protein [Candidatus Deianiraea vastatrix]|uniref:Uncharacterized protein n=1 Tax=Candidatus Deianiraea vastatrix TaxID=2163644 RepID=A0A5B8XE88_9RICK|nr:hypothetical protein [Candidatus Deianiraea vastatrix]QED23628.1 hypothetical protein Deia_00841 [Candidatus Deianiraea vastatrix]
MTVINFTNYLNNVSGSTRIRNAFSGLSANRLRIAREYFSNPSSVTIPNNVIQFPTPFKKKQSIEEIKNNFRQSRMILLDTLKKLQQISDRNQQLSYKINNKKEKIMHELQQNIKNQQSCHKQFSSPCNYNSNHNNADEDNDFNQSDALENSENHNQIDQDAIIKFSDNTHNIRPSYLNKLTTNKPKF